MVYTLVTDYIHVAACLFHLFFSHSLPCQEYSAIFAGAGTNPGEKTLEDKFFEKEVRASYLLLLQ